MDPMATIFKDNSSKTNTEEQKGSLASLKKDFKELKILHTNEKSTIKSIEQVLPNKSRWTSESKNVGWAIKKENPPGIGKGGWATTWEGRQHVRRGRSWNERLKPRHGNSNE